MIDDKGKSQYTHSDLPNYIMGYKYDSASKAALDAIFPDKQWCEEIISLAK